MSVLELKAIVQPRLNQVVDGDSNAALGVLAALSLGLYHLRRTGQGQFVMTSMIGGNAWCYSDDFCRYEGKPPVPICDDDYYGTSALDRVYEAADGSWVCLAVRSDKEFAALVHALDLPELLTDDRFATDKARQVNDAELLETLAGRFQQRPAAEWEAMLSKVDVGCVEANMNGHAAFTSFDPVLRETGLTLAFDHPLFGSMVRAAPPISFSETPGRVEPPCRRGQHNQAILTELGLSPEEINGLEKEGIIFPPD
jgi:crotonobetainyl-CoA:carnitine CoA-transferase CaiB-like acyl-CoA transferase